MTTRFIYNSPPMFDSLLQQLKRLLGIKSSAPPGASGAAPAAQYALEGVKLQIPGPQEINQLHGYASRYFFLDELGRMCFWVDCSETGATANSKYVRSELRHLASWPVASPTLKRMAIRVSINSTARPDSVTIMQVHSVTPTGENVPPLLRIYRKDGMLTAALKRSQNGADTEHIALTQIRGASGFECEITVQNAQLEVLVNGRSALKRDISYWHNPCYFKTGCYPQATIGFARVNLSAYEISV